MTFLLWIFVYGILSACVGGGLVYLLRTKALPIQVVVRISRADRLLMLGLRVPGQETITWIKVVHIPNEPMDLVLRDLATLPEGTDRSES